jgi:hypothetical protein
MSDDWERYVKSHYTADEVDDLLKVLARRDEKIAALLAVLRQCVEAMERYDKIIGSIHFSHPHLGWSDEDATAIKAAFAAARPWLEKK